MITSINNVTLPTKQISKQNFPSFGFAKLSEVGRKSSDSFGYQQNEFIDSCMFDKQKGLKMTALSKKISDGGVGPTGEKFTEICTTYGCTNNAKSNADFIKNQILSKKAQKDLSRLIKIHTLPEAAYGKGLEKLYIHNYDNPDLSYKETKALLEMQKDTMDSADYVKHIGILETGIKKK